MPARLSVNLNKVATLRNARGGHVPDLLQAARTCLEAGARGLTVHPRADERHITRQDTYTLSTYLEPLRAQVELNIEGDPRPDWLELVRATCPHQATLVPVRPGEITSEAGWQPDADTERHLRTVISDFHRLGIRVSVFVEPDSETIAWAHQLEADRIELYTEPFARAFRQGRRIAQESFEVFAHAAQRAHELGLGVNAGHDLDLDNLRLFRRLPHLAEVSIGHALISRALFAGLPTVVHEYLQVLNEV